LIIPSSHQKKLDNQLELLTNQSRKEIMNERKQLEIEGFELDD
jgi:predicted N-acyltransferase